MPRESTKPLKLVTVRIFQDDHEYLKLAYAAAGYNKVLRALTARHVRRLRTKTVENLEPEELTPEELANV